MPRQNHLISYSVTLKWRWGGLQFIEEITIRKIDATIIMMSAFATVEFKGIVLSLKWDN